LACTGVLPYRRREAGTRVLLGAGTPWLAVWLLLAATLLATQSRGGIAATGLGLLAWLMAAPKGTPLPGRLTVLVAAGGALAAVAVLALDERLVALPQHMDQRLAVYGASLELIARRPWLGHGPGSFGDVLAMVGQPDPRRPFVHAHNVYLQAAVALGVPAAAVATTGVGLLALNGWRAARDGAVAGRVGFAAAVLIAAHGAVDFAPQVPAVAFTGAALLALAAAPPPADSPAPGATTPAGRWRARPIP
jgi:O-antigen ligase